MNPTIFQQTMIQLRENFLKNMQEAGLHCRTIEAEESKKIEIIEGTLQRLMFELSKIE